MPLDGPAYFIGDAHLGMPIRGYEAREQHLYSFLEHISAKASQLFIMGDLFDFWVEYRHAIRPEYFLTLHFLKRCVEAGVEVHYLAGNHDFALESFLPHTLGIKIHRDEYSAEIQGKKVFMHHSDGLISQDKAYRILKKVVRNPLNQKLFKMLHPNVGIGIASFFSKSSRKYLVANYHKEMLRNYRAVARNLLDKEYDVVVFGHTHYPQLNRYGEKYFCNPGEWIRRYTYGELSQGQMSLWEFKAGQPPMKLALSEENTGKSCS
jgi:UDP-2,3-diacylglucosamine hydrolase